MSKKAQSKGAQGVPTKKEVPNFVWYIMGLIVIGLGSIIVSLFFIDISLPTFTTPSINGLSTVWTIIIVVAILLVLARIFRGKLPMWIRLPRMGSGERQALWYFIGMVFIIFLIRDMINPTYINWWKRGSSSYNQSSSSNPYEGLPRINYGYIDMQGDTDYAIDLQMESAYWFHPEKSGDYIVEITDGNGEVISKTKIVKRDGKQAQYVPVYTQRLEIPVGRYKWKIYPGSKGFISPNQVL